MKVCKRCEVDKDVSEYYFTDKKRKYIDSVCKECRKNQARDYRKETPEERTLRKESKVYKTHDPEYRRNYYLRTRDAHLERSRRSQANRKEELREYYREYAKNNKDKLTAIKREHYLNNKDDYLFRAYERKIAERKSVFRITPKQREEMVSRFNSSCALTGDVDIHIDHFIPMSTGHGETSIRNLIPLGVTLNRNKSDKNPFEWAETLSEEKQLNFIKVVEYLAELNGLTVDEYREFVFWCFENRREVDEITDENRDSLELWLRTREVA